MGACQCDAKNATRPVLCKLVTDRSRPLCKPFCQSRKKMTLSPVEEVLGHSKQRLHHRMVRLADKTTPLQSVCRRLSLWTDFWRL